MRQAQHPTRRPAPTPVHGATRLLYLTLCLLAATGLSGCIMVGASSRGGFFLWPGGLGLVLMILLFLLLRRR